MFLKYNTIIEITVKLLPKLIIVGEVNSDTIMKIF